MYFPNSYFTHISGRSLVLPILILSTLCLSLQGQSLSNSGMTFEYYAIGHNSDGDKLNGFSGIGGGGNFEYEHPINGKKNLTIFVFRSTLFEPYVSFNDPKLPQEISVSTHLYSLRARVYRMGVNRYKGLYNDRFHLGVSGFLQLTKIDRVFEDITHCEYVFRGDFMTCTQQITYPGIKFEAGFNLYADITISNLLHLFYTTGLVFGPKKYADWTFKVRTKQTEFPTIKGYINGNAYTSSIGFKIDLLNLWNSVRKC